MSECVNGGVYGWMGGCVSGWEDLWVGGWKYGRMSGSMDVLLELDEDIARRIFNDGILVKEILAMMAFWILLRVSEGVGFALAPLA